MKITLNDGTELTTLAVNGAGRFFQNAQRDSLEFVFAKNAYSFDVLDNFFSDKNKMRKIILMDDNNTQYVYDDYVLRISMTLSPAIIKPETSSEPEETEERISIIMVQQTYMEKLIEQLLSK